MYGIMCMWCMYMYVCVHGIVFVCVCSVYVCMYVRVHGVVCVCGVYAFMVHGYECACIPMCVHTRTGH